MVKKEVFEWTINKQKNIELRRGKAKKGDVAVFQCGRNILRRKIIKREKGNLKDVLRKDNYRNIIPSANTLEEALTTLRNCMEQPKKSSLPTILDFEFSQGKYSIYDQKDL